MGALLIASLTRLSVPEAKHPDGFTSFQTFSHVAVKTRSDMPTLGEVAYVGTSNGNLGLYVTDFQTKGPATPPAVNATSPVVIQGQSLAGLSALSGSLDPNTRLPVYINFSTMPVASISIECPLDTNGNVAFLAQDTAGNQSIILAAPRVLGTDVSHWQGNPNSVM